MPVGQKKGKALYIPSANTVCIALFKYQLPAFAGIASKGILV